MWRPGIGRSKTGSRNMDICGQAAWHRVSLASQTLYLTATQGKGLVKCMHQFRSLLQNLEERTSHV